MKDSVPIGEFKTHEEEEFFNLSKDSVSIKGDITSPINVKWKALSLQA